MSRFAQKKITRRAALCGLSGLVVFPAAALPSPSPQQKFLVSVFGEMVPAPQTLWLTKPLKTQLRKILRHDYASLRVRYWQDQSQTVWVLDEIGKTKPITAGFVIRDGAIARVSVLAYRESHGWEIKHDFFTRQFVGARLPTNYELDQNIDGISGATLSVRAMKKLARLALFLDQQVAAQ
jgi:hypothetical protein